MATFEYNDEIKFVLPSGFIFSREEDDDGNETVRIMREDEDYKGKTGYKFFCYVDYMEYDPETVGDETTSENLLEVLAEEEMKGSKRTKLLETPKTILLSKGMSISTLDCAIKGYFSTVLVQISDWSVMHLIATGAFYADDPSENIAMYENLYEVLKAARINGKKLPVDSTTPYEIKDALLVTFDEDGEASDTSSKLPFHFTAGDETTTYEEAQEAKQADEEAERAEEWMRKYEKYLETNPVIDFNGTIFVFSGLARFMGLRKITR